MKEEIEIYNLIVKAGKDKFESTLEMFVEMCRYKQKEYTEGNSEHSGVEFMIHAVHEGNLSNAAYMAILPAVLEYNTPFILTIK